MAGPRRGSAAKPPEAEVATPPTPEAATPPAPETADAEAKAKADAAAQSAPAAGDVKVIMNITITGLRNGEPWPAPGGEISLPAEEAETYVRLGYARTVE